MTLTEYNCDNSNAVQRIAFNSKKKELLVQFRNNNNVYLYSNFNFDIHDYIIKGGSIGHIVNEIKKQASCRRVKDFPHDVKMYQPSIPPSYTTQSSEIRQNRERRKNRNTGRRPTRRGRRIRNYSNNWLNLIEDPSTVTRDIEYFDRMIGYLGNMHPHLPPSRAPPRYFRTATDMGSHGENTSAGTSVHLSNAFSDLSNDEDDSTEEEEDVIDSGSANVRSIQVRYLMVRIVCLKVEFIRKGAIDALRNREYNQVRLMWQAAWNTLFSCQRSLDEWYALFCSFSEDLMETLNMPDSHEFQQLQELFAGIELLSADTEREKEKSLRGLYKALEFVNRKLNPMLHARDTVKLKLGEEFWKNNPRPDGSYAERRKALEKSYQEITAAIDSLQRLSFNVVASNY